MRTTWRDRFPSSMLTDREQLVQLARELETVIYDTRPDPSSKRACPGYEKKSRAAALNDNIDCDEVFPGIILGNGSTAKNKKYLKKIGITHVLNTAMGDGFGMINTDATFYKDVGFKFLGIHTLDLPNTKMSLHFDKVADFIDSALASGGKVYVHCLMGVSRSSTCVIAFLMIKRDMTAVEALKLVRSHRLVAPNEGFLLQLATLDIRLQERRALRESTALEASVEDVEELSGSIPESGIKNKARGAFLSKTPCDLS